MNDERFPSSASYNNADHQADAYVGDLLKRERPYQLPANFADKMMTRIQVYERKRQRREYAWIGVGFVLLAIAALVSLAWINVTFTLGFLRSLGAYQYVMGFGVGFVILLHVLDRTLLKNKTSSRNY